MLQPNEKVPDIFNDPVYNKSKYWKLSTSQITSEYYDSWGWGEVVPDGYGLPYSIKEHSIYVGVASRVKNASEIMKSTIQDSLLDMKKLILSVQDAPLLQSKI